MAPRSKKETAQAVAPAPVAPMPVVPMPAAIAAGPDHVVVSRDSFIKVRDSVYARMSTIQDLIKSFSIDYLRQTNLLLGEGTNIDGAADLDQIQNAFGAVMPALVPQVAPVEEKKERKKRVHDPNAPKRPLTPYFLYMQTARPIIASDLGSDAPKGAVQEEGQRRWSVMSPGEKAGWNNAYQYNLRLYNARVHSYKNGNPEAKNMTDEDALKYADQFGIETPNNAPVDDVVGSEEHAIQEQLAAAAAAEPEEETPAKTPKKGKESRKRKTATPAAIADADTSAAAAATPAAAAATPTDKKRKRTSKAVEAAAEEPKKSGRKKARSG